MRLTTILYIDRYLEGRLKDNFYDSFFLSFVSIFLLCFTLLSKVSHTFKLRTKIDRMRRKKQQKKNFFLIPDNNNQSSVHINAYDILSKMNAFSFDTSSDINDVPSHFVFHRGQKINDHETSIGMPFVSRIATAHIEKYQTNKHNIFGIHHAYVECLT